MRVSKWLKTGFSWLQAKTAAGECNNAVSGAGTTSQANSTQLTAEVNNLTTVSANNGVRLWTPDPGDKCAIYNSSGTTCLVYPATGGAINAAGANGSLSLPTAKSVLLVAITSTQWMSIPVVPS